MIRFPVTHEGKLKEMNPGNTPKNSPQTATKVPKPSSKSGPNPRWETGILFLSFVGLCVWYFGRQAAFHAHLQPSVWWHAIPAIFLVLLVWVLLRRSTRATAALKETDPARRRGWN